MSETPCPGRWPLHPKPRPYETLEQYTRRLAKCYGVRYEYFCLRALSIPLADSQARRFTEPASGVLERLSAGTGVPIEQLEHMTLGQVWARLMDEINQLLSTSEGAEFERWTGPPCCKTSNFRDTPFDSEKTVSYRVAKIRCETQEF